VSNSLIFQQKILHYILVVILLGIEPHIDTVISYARKLIIVNKSVTILWNIGGHGRFIPLPNLSLFILAYLVNKKSLES